MDFDDFKPGDTLNKGNDVWRASGNEDTKQGGTFSAAPESANDSFVEAEDEGLE